MHRVLLIDDDADFSYGLTTLLQRNGCEVRHAPNAREGVALAKKELFHVALVDLHLPDTDGLRLIDALAGAEPTLSTVCLTGRDDTSSVVQAMRHGALDYLTKPVTKDTLLAAVTAAAEHTTRRREGASLPAGPSMPTGQSPAWKRTLDLIRAAASAPRTTVLLTGEPGVGKEVAANLLHALSRRSEGPLVSMNAACFTPALMESELFGHEPGAFTGAQKLRRGLLEQAHEGFLFLDEIGELPLDLQSKLLRVLEGHPFRRLGGEHPVTCDVRLVCATNRDLVDGVKRGLFRPDLYERLRVFDIRIPPLRERREDIPHLVNHFLAKLGAELGYGPTARVSLETMEQLTRHAWPGNVRELRNVIERALVLAAGGEVTMRHLPPELHGVTAPAVFSTPDEASNDIRLEEVMRRHIIAVFHQNSGNVTRAAEKLGISRLALRRRLQAYGLKPVQP